MNVAELNVTAADAALHYKEYRQHRDKWDSRDKAIARIYKAIASGKKVISVNKSIVAAGIDELGRPRLAIMRADQQFCRCYTGYNKLITFTNEHNSRAAEWHFEIPFERKIDYLLKLNHRARLPRIPPALRPEPGELAKYHILWEAEWTSIPRDPYLLKRLDIDAWLVCGAWDLTDVEMAVISARP